MYTKFEEKNILKKIKSLYLISFILILVLAFILRFYALGKVPAGLYQDETAIGYNAYSIIKTGKDEYGKSFPLYFKSFGDYKLPVYIYATVPSILVFGLTPFAVRFPSAFFGFLTVPLLALLIYEFTKNKKLAIMSMLLLAITPWHLHYSRATFEVSISLFLFVLGTYLLHKALSLQKLRGLFFLGTLCFVLDIYTYNLTRLLSPLLFILILVFFRKKIRSISRLELILTFVAGVILLIPLIVTLSSGGGASSASGTLIFSSAVSQAPLLEFRSYLVNSGFFMPGLLFNKLFSTVWLYINNLFAYFSVDFFFISGSTHGNHGIGNVGLFYLFELPFIIFGIVTVIKKRLEWGLFLLLFAAATIAVAALTRDVPQATRSFFLLLPLTAFAALGTIEFYTWIIKINNLLIKTIIMAGILLFVSYNIIFYFASYYFRFPVLYAKAWSLGDQPLVNYINSDKKYNKIIVDKKSGLKYTSILFYSAFSPSEFQKTVKRQPDDSEGFSEVSSFGNYEFRDINWDKDYKQPNNLIITNDNSKPSQIPSFKTFYYPTRPVVIPVGQNILQYPATDVSYMLVKSLELTPQVLKK
jgi:4-amino-4-deoxy-L-arabinose transferase-like glycosyltransferase